MDIAEMSTILSQAKVQQQVGISVMKIVMDSAKGKAIDLVKMLESNTILMEQSVNPHLGGNIDIKL